MKMYKIVHIPNKVLTTPTKPVTTFDALLKKLVIDMEETLIAQVEPQGVGLAATQVGYDISLFITKPTLETDTQTFINPKILEFDWETPFPDEKRLKKKKDTPLEGCLSIPRIWSPVKRAFRVNLQYQDITGTQHVKWFEDFDSIIVQHEVDHLNGILFTQRALEQNCTLYEERNGELEAVSF